MLYIGLFHTNSLENSDSASNIYVTVIRSNNRAMPNVGVHPPENPLIGLVFHPIQLKHFSDTFVNLGLRSCVEKTWQCSPKFAGPSYVGEPRVLGEINNIGAEIHAIFNDIFSEDVSSPAGWAC